MRSASILLAGTDPLIRSTTTRLVVVGIDGSAEGFDAASLATTIADACGAELMLVAADRLARVVNHEDCDAVVLGSSGRGPQGRVRIGTATRKLLREARCPVAVAPRGLCARDQPRLGVIGVGYDGTPEAEAALGRAASLTRATRARLRVRAVLNDRLAYLGPVPSDGPEIQAVWDEVILPDVELLREEAERAASVTGVAAEVEARPGHPAEELIALSREVDLLVIGSRRWGAEARVLLGSTGEEVMHEARCSVMVVPRPVRWHATVSNPRPTAEAS